jgi:hypothetical protein
MKSDQPDGIFDADECEPLPQTIEVSAAATDQKTAMARLRERFGVGHY